MAAERGVNRTVHLDGNDEEEILVPLEEDETLDDIRQELDEKGGTMSVSMRRLRNAFGAKKLGVVVRRDISSELARRGIAHYPESLPDSQNDWVRLFKVDSPAARLVNAVVRPGEDSDAYIQEVLSGEERKILERIKELAGRV